MTDITLKTLQETQKELLAKREELQGLQGELITGDASVLERHRLVIEQIQRLKDVFIEQREALSTVLPDGTKLWPGQHEALERFADNNKLDINLVLSKITVEGSVVTGCDFSEMKLTTLAGLKGLVRLRSLSVSGNPRLTSLEGMPMQAIEEIYANACGLKDDLSALSGADALKTLNITGNHSLTSLKGTPTRAIQEIYASACDLKGDLSAISGADELRQLWVIQNINLTSLTGVPTRALECIRADYCGLTGDLSALSEADKLRTLWVVSNKDLASLRGVSMQAIESIFAYDCALTGDHTFLSQAPNLRVLHVMINCSLTLDQTKFASSVTIAL
jgi:hypothetical protein